MDVQEFLTSVQGSDAKKDELVTAFAKTDFGSAFLTKYSDNNKEKLFDVDTEGRIINNEKLSPKIGELIGHERKKLHTERDKTLSEITGIALKEGEGKGFSQRALTEYMEANKGKSPADVQSQIEAINQTHIAALEKIKSDNSTLIKGHEEKYNTLQGESQNKEKVNLISTATLGLDLGDLDPISEKFLKTTLKEIQEVISFEDGKTVLKNEDGTIMRKPNQDEYTVKEFVAEALEPLLSRQKASSGGGSSSYTDSKGGVAHKELVDTCSTRTQVQAKVHETLQKRGLSKSDPEYQKQLIQEMIKIKGVTGYNKLPS